MYTKIRLALLGMLFAASAAYACDSVQFQQATAVMSGPTMGAGYVTLLSGKDDTLKSLSSDCCEAVELHASSMEGGVMRMRQLDSLKLKAGVPVALTGEHGKGESMHLMLIGAKKPLKPGQKFNITFLFEKEAPHQASFTVVKRAGGSGMHH